MSRQLNLMTGLLGLGMHLGGWRHKEAWSNQVMNLDHAIDLAKAAEAGLFDLLFLADGNAVRQINKPALFAANSPSDRPAVFEPITLLTAVSRIQSSLACWPPQQPPTRNLIHWLGASPPWII